LTITDFASISLHYALPIFLPLLAEQSSSPALANYDLGLDAPNKPAASAHESDQTALRPHHDWTDALHRLKCAASHSTGNARRARSEEHTSELQSRDNLV